MSYIDGRKTSRLMDSTLRFEFSLAQANYLLSYAPEAGIGEDKQKATSQ
jgi:hypothetical protein